MKRPFVEKLNIEITTVTIRQNIEVTCDPCEVTFTLGFGFGLEETGMLVQCTCFACSGDWYSCSEEGRGNWYFSG